MLLGASWLSVDDTFDLRLCRHPSKPTQPLRQCEGASVDVLPKEAEHVTPFCRKKNDVGDPFNQSDHVRTPAALASLPDTGVMP